MEYREFYNGVKIPMVGFGVYMIFDYDACKKAVSEAIQAGYRLFDSARAYGNEKAVGDAIKESGIPREEFFLTSKIWIDDYDYDKCLEAIDKSLQAFDTDYIDDCVILGLS